MSPDASAEASVTSARARASGIGSMAGSSAAIVAASGKTCVSAAPSRPGRLRRDRCRARMPPEAGHVDGRGQRRPAQRDQPRAEPPRGGDRDLLAEHRPDRDLVPVDRAHRAPPGQPAASGPITGSPAKNPEIAPGPRPGRAAAGSAARRRSRRAGQTAPASSPPSSRRERGAGEHAASVRKADRSFVLVGGGDLDSGNGAGGEEAEHPAEVDRRPERQPQPQHARCPSLGPQARGPCRVARPVPAAHEAACRTPRASSR